LFYVVCGCFVLAFGANSPPHQGTKKTACPERQAARMDGNPFGRFLLKGRQIAPFGFLLFPRSLRNRWFQTKGQLCPVLTFAALAISVLVDIGAT